MFVGIKRFSHKDNIERIIYDARIAPFGQDKYGWLFSQLGEPKAEKFPGCPNDIVSFQASLNGGVISRQIGPHQIYGAVQDEYDAPTSIESNSIFDTIELLKNTPGYLVAWPTAGYLDWLPKLGGAPDEFGFTHSKMLGLWRLQWQDYSAVSFDRERLLQVKQHSALAESERPAQIRIHVGDLANSKLRGWANAQNFRRSWSASMANVKLLNLVAQQFKLPSSEALEFVENLLDAELVCSVGGEYELAGSGDREVWQSSAWPDFVDPVLPEGYVSPLLTWFRGFELELIQSASQFSIHGFLDVERQSNSALPSFELFKGFGNMFGQSDEKN